MGTEPQCLFSNGLEVAGFHGVLGGQRGIDPFKLSMKEWSWHRIP
jgi:hypothetical protein